MNHDLAETAAAKTTDHVGVGLTNHSDSAYKSLINEVNQVQQRLSPADYKDYLADLNKDLKVPLHGVEIVGTFDDKDPMLGLHAGNKDVYFTKAATDSMSKFLSHNSVSADGTAREELANGDIELIKDTGHSTVDTVISDNASRSRRTETEANGNSTTNYGDGRGESVTWGNDQQRSVVAWGPNDSELLARTAAVLRGEEPKFLSGK